MKQQTAGALCLTVMVADAMVSPFGRVETFRAWEVFWAVLLDTAVIVCLAYFLLRGAKTKKLATAWYAAAGSALLVAAACSFLDTERFYRFCTDEPLPVTLTLVVLLLVALYALRCGTQTIARTAEILLWLLAASILLLLVANAGKMQVVNLQPAWRSQHSFWRACVVYFRFPATLLLLCLVPDGQEKDAPVMRPQTLFFVMAVPAALHITNAIMTELVLGEGMQGYAQASYTLARLGGLSVFRRLDALHLSIWMFALAMKSIILLCGASRALKCCAHTKTAKQQGIILLFCLVVAMAVMSVATPDVQQLAVGALALLGAVIWCLRGRAKA